MLAVKQVDERAREQEEVRQRAQEMRAVLDRDEERGDGKKRQERQPRP
jgi:hypothetical protein